MTTQKILTPNHTLTLKNINIYNQQKNHTCTHEKKLTHGKKDLSEKIKDIKLQTKTHTQTYKQRHKI